jgi:hypothetical protein
MRQVLLALALTSATSAARMDADSGGGSARHYEHVVLAGALGPDEDGAPHLYFAELYDLAVDDDGRARVFRQAKDALEAIWRSKGDPTKTETREELHARIVEHGEGWPRLEVARWARTSETVVAQARRDAGRDEELGRPTVDFGELTAEERRAQVRTRASRGMNAKEIARALRLPYITVRRDLGRST